MTRGRVGGGGTRGGGDLGGAGAARGGGSGGCRKRGEGPPGRQAAGLGDEAALGELHEGAVELVLDVGDHLRVHQLHLEGCRRGPGGWGAPLGRPVTTAPPACVAQPTACSETWWAQKHRAPILRGEMEKPSARKIPPGFLFETSSQVCLLTPPGEGGGWPGSCWMDPASSTPPPPLGGGYSPGVKKIVALGAENKILQKPTTSPST